jgi:hypothetical protein
MLVRRDFFCEISQIAITDTKSTADFSGPENEAKSCVCLCLIPSQPSRTPGRRL